MGYVLHPPSEILLLEGEGGVGGVDEVLEHTLSLLEVVVGEELVAVLEEREHLLFYFE